MSPTNSIAQATANCDADGCRKPWYGKVRFCPYCGKEARGAVATLAAQKAVAANGMSGESPKKQDRQIPPDDTIERQAGKEAALPPATGDVPIKEREPVPPPLPKWVPALILVSLLAGTGLWYLNKPPDPALISAAPPVSAPAPRPMKMPDKIAPHPSVPESRPPMAAVPAVSVGDVLSLFPTSEAGKYLDAMLEGAKLGNDASIINARRLLQDVVLPRRGDRNRARASNTDALYALRNGDAMEAVNLFLNAVKADPADEEIVNNLAYALYKSKRLQEALDSAVAALALAPERSAAWANMAMIQADKGHADIAVAAFLLAHRFSQNRQKTKKFLRQLMREESSVQLRAAAEKALDRISAMPAAVAPQSHTQPSGAPVAASPQIATENKVRQFLGDARQRINAGNYQGAVDLLKFCAMIDQDNQQCERLRQRAELLNREMLRCAASGSEWVNHRCQ